jgi:hypothetical protein
MPKKESARGCETTGPMKTYSPTMPPEPRHVKVSLRHLLRGLLALFGIIATHPRWLLKPDHRSMVLRTARNLFRS